MLLNVARIDKSTVDVYSKHFDHCLKQTTYPFQPIVLNQSAPSPQMFAQSKSRFNCQSPFNHQAKSVANVQLNQSVTHHYTEFFFVDNSFHKCFISPNAIYLKQTVPGHFKSTMQNPISYLDSSSSSQHTTGHWSCLRMRLGSLIPRGSSPDQKLYTRH